MRTSPFADGSRYHIPVDKILEAIVNIRNTTDTKVVTFFNLTYVDLTLVRIPSVGYIEGAPEPKKMSFRTPECPMEFNDIAISNFNITIKEMATEKVLVPQASYHCFEANGPNEGIFWIFKTNSGYFAQSIPKTGVKEALENIERDAEVTL